MGNEIFRKKSLEKIQSPESLNDYLRVSNPGMWLLLGAIVVLLIGACVWGIFGSVTSQTEAVAVVEDGQVVCYVEEAYRDRVASGMKVILEDREGTVNEVIRDQDGVEITVTMENPPEDGFYTAQIILSSERPVSFVLN